MQLVCLPVALCDWCKHGLVDLSRKWNFACSRDVKGHLQVPDELVVGSPDRDQAACTARGLEGCLNNKCVRYTSCVPRGQPLVA